MLISVGVRCLNEEELLPIFIANHQFADEIVVVDGGSTDKSKGIVSGVQLGSWDGDLSLRWIEFPNRVRGKKGGWRNPEGKHVNAVIDACRGDWLWITEMDAIPTLTLQQDIRDILKATSEKAVGSKLYYIAPDIYPYEHYPELIRGHGLTCWHRSLNLRANPAEHFSPIIPFQQPWLTVNPPLARVHLSWRTEEVLQEKWRFYREVHGLDQKHPNDEWKRERLPEGIEWRGMKR